MTFANLLRYSGGCAIILCASGLLTGCGGGGEPVASVSGTVTIAGKAPGEGLIINFVGASGQPVSGLVAAAGNYRVEKVPVGEVQVGFTYAPPNKAASKEGGDRPDPDAKPARAKAVKETVPFPKRYMDPRESGLTFTVKPGEDNKFNHDIPKQ